MIRNPKLSKVIADASWGEFVRQLESAVGALERATESFEPVLQRHEYEVAAARSRVEHEQHEKEFVKEREYPMPRL